MPAGPEAVGLHYRRRRAEPSRDHSRVVGIASERDRFPAFFTPPGNDLRMDRHLGIHF
jgi:hypothetical protein